MALVRAVVPEVALDLELLREAAVLRSRVRVHSFLRELVPVVLDETRVQREPTDQFVLKAAFVHQAEVDVTRE